MFKPLSDKEEFLAKHALDIAINIHKELGPGLLESVYAKCFYYELNKREIKFEKQKEVPIIYHSLHIDDGLRLDLLIEDLLVVELKAQENFHPVGSATSKLPKINRQEAWFFIEFSCSIDEGWNKKGYTLNLRAT